MSDTDNRKSGFELDVVKLPPLPVTDSEKKEDDEKQLKPQEKTPPQEKYTKADVVKNIPPTQKSRSPIVWIVLVAMIIGILLFFLLIPKNQLPLVKNENIPAQFNQSMVTFIESTEKMRSILQTIDNISNRINSKAKITTILDAVKSAEDYFPVYGFIFFEYFDKSRCCPMY